MEQCCLFDLVQSSDCDSSGVNETVVLLKKGAEGINAVSKKLGNSLVVKASDSVHISCRKLYTKPQNVKCEITTSSENDPNYVTRKNNCLTSKSSVFSVANLQG